MSQYITTFNAQGEETFSSSISPTQNPHTIPLGKITYLYTTHSMPLNLNTEADIEQYSKDRTNGLPPTAPVPRNGTSAAVVELAPGATTPKRRTMTVGVFYVVEGVVRLRLENGEEKVLEKGGCMVLRAALHTWKNETPENGWAKLIVFAQSVKEVKIGDKGLESVWL